jgi:surface antigen
MWPFDPKTTGLPTTHKPTGAYIMWAGSPYAHVHIVGRPQNDSARRRLQWSRTVVETDRQLSSGLYSGIFDSRVQSRRNRIFRLMEKGI